jgi:glutathione S-transferase
MSLTLYEHPFATYCWKPLIALYERDIRLERRQVDDEADRANLAELWPMASIPTLVDDAAGVTLPESTIVTEYLDRFGEAPPLIPAEPEAARQARLWDRIMDLRVQTPTQKIVLDNLRPEGACDPHGVTEARSSLDRIYAVMDDQVSGGGWLAGPDFTLADVAAAPALFYGRAVRRWDEEGLAALTGYYEKLSARPAVARVIDEARPFRHLFPLPWPSYVE